MINKILRRAKAILHSQDRYVTGTWAVDKACDPCAPAGKLAVRWNMEGVMFKAAYDLGLEPDDAMKAAEMVFIVQRSEEGLWDQYVSEGFGRIIEALNIAIVKSEAS